MVTPPGAEDVNSNSQIMWVLMQVPHGDHLRGQEKREGLRHQLIHPRDCRTNQVKTWGEILPIYVKSYCPGLASFIS